MPTLSPAKVNTVRAVAIWCLRGVSVWVCGYGAYLVLKMVLFGSGQGNPLYTAHTWMDIGEDHALYRGAAMICVGAALGAGSRRLVHWMIAVPECGCPRCGHDGAPTDDPRCSECGLRGVE